MKAFTVTFRVKIFIPMLLAFLLCMTYQSLIAQDFEPGYIVLNSNDTIYGSVKNRNDSKLLNKIKFKNYKGKVSRYSAEKISGYKSGIYNYESLWYAEESEFFNFYYYNRMGYGEKIFLKVLTKGSLSCYEREFINDDESNYPDSFELFLREGETSMQRATQGIFGLKKKSLSKYFWDCPALVEKINNSSIKRPLEVVEYYNEFCGGS